MLPTNVMTFMKKIVTNDEAPTPNTQETGGTFGKLKQTLSSSLLTAQDKVNKISPRSSILQNDAQSIINNDKETEYLEFQADDGYKEQKPKPNDVLIKSEVGRRSGACRICLRSFQPEDFHKTCFECQQKVCEDCASYSILEENEDTSLWRCSVCRRKMSSRICLPQESTDSMLDVPVFEALHRRHSETKLGASTQNMTPNNFGTLLPPRSPELRRHSDVSPASLKELEKLKGSKRTGGDFAWQGVSCSTTPTSLESPIKDCTEPLIAKTVSQIVLRRNSRIARQHSYDEEITNLNFTGANSSTGMKVESSINLGITTMPRRKSAYDVFSPSGIQINPQGAQTRSSGENLVVSRRSSFRAPHSSTDLQNDDSPSSEKGILVIDDDKRSRRRGSQLPDLNAFRGGFSVTQAAPIFPPLIAFTGPNLEDLEAPRRQTSLDGENIKIVIHDVDSGPICSSKRRIVLQRDPSDKAHRTRGFGMRVVGGKTGADGRLFAYIVWTVPGGPAEQNGLQQGDKILEWNGISLIDRSFEEVCTIMDRTGDIIELLIEHATDFRMCDLFDDNLIPSITPNPKSFTRIDDGALGLGFTENDPAIDKSPASPTRRKLPKTPV